MKIVYLKNNTRAIKLNQDGVIGDAHAGKHNKQISLLNQKFAIKNKDAINFIVDDLTKLNILDKQQIGETILEVTQIGKKCAAKKCETCDLKQTCKVPRECIYARVISGGEIKLNDIIEHLPRSLKILIIRLATASSITRRGKNTL